MLKSMRGSIIALGTKNYIYIERCNETVKSFIMRVALLAGGMAILLFIIFSQRILIPAGIFLGAFLSLYKIRIYRKILGATAQQEKKTSVLATLSGGLHIALSFLVLLVSVMVDQWLFMGIAIGLLISALTILINIVTERIGLTHNEWAGWF